MVLKSIVRFIINKYLKDYIEQLDNEKLKLDFKHGNVSLENLHLKPESLVGLGIPVTVAVGFIEKLSIVIPWRNLRSNPTKVQIDGFYMLIVPKNEMKQDLTEYHAEKMRRVQRKLENLRKSSSDENQVDEKEKGFFEKMKIQMMQNLQVSLTNLHLCYETTSTTKLGHPFSFGITIQSIQLYTTTNNKPIGKIKEHTLVIFKMKQIDCLSMYWNTQSKSRLNLPFDDVVQDLKSNVGVYDPYTNYLLYPTNLKLDLEMIIRFAQQNFERPIYKVFFNIDTISFNIDPKQLSDLLDFIKFQNYSAFYDRCREYRQLYYRQTVDHIQLTEPQLNRIHILESKLDVFTLAYIRHTIQLENNFDDNTNYNWWEWWWNGNTTSNQDIHKANLHNQEDFFSEQLLNIDTQIIIHKLQFNLLSPPKKSKKIETISHIKIENTKIDFKRRSISSSILFLIDLGYIEIFGLKGNRAEGPLMLSTPSKSFKPLIHMHFELAPIDKKSDFHLDLIIQPLTIIYNAATINEIVNNFEPIDYQNSAKTIIRKERTTEQMENDLLNKKVFHLNIEMKSVSFLLPQDGSYQIHSNTYIFHFNNFNLKSCLYADKENDSYLFKKRISEKRYYIKYKLIANDLGINYLQSNNIRRIFLKPIELIDINFYKSIYPDDVNLTDWRIDVRIPSMNRIQLTESIYKTLSDHYLSVPSFNSSMGETLNRINFYFNIFAPYTTIESDLSINKCSLTIIHPDKSIQTDIQMLITRKGDDDQLNKLIKIKLKHLILSIDSDLSSKQSINPIYKNKKMKIFYSDTSTKF